MSIDVTRRDFLLGGAAALPLAGLTARRAVAAPAVIIRGDSPRRR